MKIAYLTPSLYLAGGVERVLTTKVNYLAEQLGHDVTVVLTDGAGEQPRFPLSSRVKVINLDIGFERMWNRSFVQRVGIYLWGQWRYRRALKRTLMQLRPDVTVSTLRREINFLCDIHDGSRKVGELHITRAHYRHFEPSESNPLKRLLARYWSSQLLHQLKRLDRLVVLTNDEVRRWPELTNVCCIPNPIPFDDNLDHADGAEACQNLSSSTSSYRSVITVARYSAEKGIDLLLEAWARIESRHPDWTLDVYGSGDSAPYKAQVQRLGLHGVRLHGPTDDVRTCYLSHDFCLLPSRFEGFGMVIIEAAACGLPTVSFACEGPRSLISDGRTGLLVAEGDVKALADAACRLMEHPDECRRMGRAAYDAVVPYRLPQVMERWQALFQSLTESV